MRPFDKLRANGGRGVSAVLLLAPLLLAACHAQPDQPGTVTTDEARQLNEAADMLDANSVDLNATTTNESQDQ